MSTARRESWWWSPDKLREAIETHGTWTKVAKATGVPCSTLRHAAGVLDVASGPPEPPETVESSVTIDGNTAVVVMEAGRSLSPKDIETLVAERGISLDDWIVERVAVNEWESAAKDADGNIVVTPLRQMRVTLVRKLPAELVLPASGVTPLPKPKAHAKPKTAPTLWLFTGDDQEPWGDPGFRDALTQWIAHNQPGQAVHLGDGLDLGGLSRHRPNPMWDLTVQDGVNALYQKLRGYREASLNTGWRMLPCNHGERLRDYQLAHCPPLYGVRAADKPDEPRLPPALSLPGLLHLDALGIEYLGNDGDYEHVTYDIVPRQLVAKHGFVTGANSAEKTARRLGVNVIYGHTHRQRIHWVTEERFGQTLTYQAVEAGCACRIDGGLGYVVAPDWQNGFATAVVWPDGSHVVEHASYVDGVLRWRDQRYTG